jgi:hypothetical protein
MTHNTTPETTPELLAVLKAIADGEITKPAQIDGKVTLAQLRSAGLVTKRGVKLTAVGTQVVTVAAKPQRRSQFKPEVLADIIARIKAMRADRKGWAVIAKSFNDEGIAAAKGGTWTPSQVRAVGMREGIPTVLEPEAKPKATSRRGRTAKAAR